MVVGKVVDATLSRYSHEYDRGRRPTLAAMNRFTSDLLDGELRDIDLPIATQDRSRVLGQVAAVLQAFRKTEVVGMSRPRSRLVLINDRVGVYTQPDYWDRKSRFYEMKSYRAVPPPPDVRLQLRLFQLGFVGFDAFLLCVDRHSTPPEVSFTPIPPLTPEERSETLRDALRTGSELGIEKVLEYIDSPVIRYTVAA